ncbi:MAG: hypothetical protein AAF799_38480 [Myxococcota bacterium]
MTRIERYVVQYASRNTAPRIWFYDEDGQSIGQAVFVRHDSPLQPDHPRSLNYRHEDFANVLDVLRNESPVYYAFSGTNSENAIRSAKEMVGEGELVGERDG